jgi:hypothetical protein
MTTVIEELVARLGWETSAGDQQKFDNYEKSLDGVLGMFAKLAAAAAAAAAGLIAATAVINQKTTENLRLARAVGLTVEEFEAWSDVLDDIGFDGARVIKMMSRFNRAIGELRGRKEYAEVSDALKMIGLRIEDIEKLDPAAQFQEVLDVALAFGDEQVADAAIAKLMGRDANLILGYLRQVGSSMTEILDKSRAVVQLNEEGARGAEAWALEWDILNTAVQTSKKQIFGLIGGALAPMLKQITAWIVANKKLIQQKLKEWAERVAKALAFVAKGALWLFERLKWLFERVDRAVQAFGGWEKVLKAVGLWIAGAVMLKAVLTIGRLAKAWKLAGSRALWAQAKMLLIPAAIIAVGAALEDIWAFLQGKKSVTEVLLKKLEAKYDVELVEPAREGLGEVADLLWELIMVGVDVFDQIVSTIGAIVELIVSMFTEDLSTAWTRFTNIMSLTWGDTWDRMSKVVSEELKVWSGVWQRWSNSFKSMAAKVVLAAKQIWGDFTSWIKNSVVDPIVGFFADMGREILNVLRDIPVVGSMIGSAAGEVAVPRGAAGIVSSGGGASTTNNQTTNRVDVGGITVNAAPGQNTEEIGREVTKRLQQEVAAGIRANSTGIER